MSKVFLLSANTTTEPYPVYPLGMGIIAAALQSGGHQVMQFDFLVAGRSEESLGQALRAFAPDFVSISLRNIDNVDSFTSESQWYLAGARRLVDIVRQQTPAPVIVGGSAFSLLPEEILDYTGADYGVVGEGERLICELLQALETQAEVPAIWRNQGGALQGEELHSPLLESSFVRYYMEHSGTVNLQTKRGCPHSCTYCTYPALEGRAFRLRDPKEVVEDVRNMQRTQQIESLFFTDSVFNDAQGHYLQLAEEMLRADLNIRWSGFFRPQGIGREELELLKRSGLYALELGTDAASDTTLGELRKGFSFEDVLEVNRACVAEELPCAHYIMFGGPGETPETLEQGLDNIALLENCVVFAFSGIRILPRTALRDRAVSEGLLDAGNTLLRPSYYFSPGIDPDTMNARIEEAFRGRRDRIFPPSEGQKRLAMMNRFGFKGLLWDKLISFKKKPNKAG